MSRLLGQRAVGMLLVSVLGTSSGMAQGVARGGHQQADSAILQRRVGTFIRLLAREYPRLAGVKYDTIVKKADDAKTRAQIKQLAAFGRPALQYQEEKDWTGWGWSVYDDSPLSPLRWTDSLRVLWPTLTDAARARELLGGEMEIVTPVLLDLAARQIAVSEIQEFAVSADNVAHGIAHHTPDEDHLGAFSALLTGTVALARNDTSHAISAFLVASRSRRVSTEPPLGLGMPAARMLAAIAEVRHDTAQLLTALTLQRLYHPPMWVYQEHIHSRGYADAEALIVDTRLRELYARYVASGRIPSDVISDMSEGKSLVKALAFDAYLDRQWGLLFDRDFPVQPFPESKTKDTSSHRLVIVEYRTGVDCGGCFNEDRIGNAIGRRYSPDQVLAIAQHSHRPVIGYSMYSGDTEPFDRWYPGFGTGQDHSVILERTLFSERGDSLNQLFRVSGIAILRVDEKRDDPPGWSTYHAAVDRIDRDLRKAPEARLQIKLNPDKDRLLVSVKVDSIRGYHPRLALRIDLVEDTVWLRSGTMRRLYQNVRRAFAATADLAMGLPLSGRVPTTVDYVFNLAEIQDDILSSRNADAMFRIDSGTANEMDYQRAERERDAMIARFIDPRDWQIDRSHLWVVTFVQDLDTSEILQAVRVKVPPMAPASCINQEFILPRCY